MSIPSEELRFYRLIEERNVTQDGAAGIYTLACGHDVGIGPAYPDDIHYLPCPTCWRLWNEQKNSGATHSITPHDAPLF